MRHLLFILSLAIMPATAFQASAQSSLIEAETRRAAAEKPATPDSDSSTRSHDTEGITDAAFIIRAADFPEYMESANAGDIESMRLAALCYMNGVGVAKNEKKGWELLGDAASAGNDEAQYDVGCMYRDGIYVKKNNTEAAYWFRRSARNGNSKALVNIARLFAEGSGVQQDFRIAAENYWRAAERGNPEGQYQYACMLRDGKGVTQNLAKALKWFDEAALQNYKDARIQADKLRPLVKTTTKKPARWKRTKK